MLEGKLVNLRSVEQADVERMYTWINDREVTRFMAARYPYSHADEERLVHEEAPNSFQRVWLAIETKDRVHIGGIDLFEVRPEDRKASLGVMIGDKPYWSNGYGSDAIITLLRFAFHEMNLNRVWLHTFEFNHRAYACYLKCGFQEEGRLRQHYYAEGRYWDSVVMGILRHEFEALHGSATEAARANEPVRAT
ncbi:MAG: GNAT family protein [Dehalococcoidia bacterium]